MKKKIQLLGTSMVVLLLICAVTVQAGQEAGKYGDAVETGQETGKYAGITKAGQETGKYVDAAKAGQETEGEEAENGQTDDDVEKNEDNGQSNKEKEDGEKEPQPGEGEDTEEGDTEPEQPVIKPIEDMLMPEIQYPDADGKNGYYKSRPNIRIIHREAEAVTKYEFIAADGSRKQGSLELENEAEKTIDLQGDCLKEGENILIVSMERKEITVSEDEDVSKENGALEESNTSRESNASEKTGSSNEEENEVIFSKEIHFLIDTKAPNQIQFYYGRAADKNTIFTNEPLEITVKSEDAGSGMEAIYYQADDGTTGTLPRGSSIIVLNPGFHGRIKAYAVDKAGNQSEPATSETILSENISPEIYIQTEGSGEIWHSGPVKVHVNVSDPGLSSGIRSLKCYSAGSVAVQEEHISSAGVTSVQADFVVDTLSEGGNGIPVIAEAVDWAGNYHTENILLYIDSTVPVIQSEGIHDKMIAGEPVNGKINIWEENILAYQKMEIWKINSDKSRELVEKKENQKLPTDMQDVGWNVSFGEDGVYEIYVAAEDLAGHKSEQHYQIIVDKTNPVIRYVDQMQGAYVPYFQWNYGKEEVVQDSTEYSYAIRLDGAFYNAGTRVTDEGARMLQVEAVDAAGNKSTAEAIFQIDHTPPKIRIYDVEDGTSYEEMAAVSISVDGKGEYLKGITVNSEKKRLETGCQIFQQTFQEVGDYHIKISAEDLAGNQENEQVTFRIEEQKRMAGGMWKPVTKIFRNENTAAAAQMVETEEEKKTSELAALCLISCSGLAVLAFVLRQWWIRRERIE